MNRFIDIAVLFYFYIRMEKKKKKEGKEERRRSKRTSSSARSPYLKLCGKKKGREGRTDRECVF